MLPCSAWEFRPDAANAAGQHQKRQRGAGESLKFRALPEGNSGQMLPYKRAAQQAKPSGTNSRGIGGRASDNSTMHDTQLFRALGKEAAEWREAHRDVMFHIPSVIPGKTIWYGAHTWHQECGFKIAHQSLDTAIQHLEELKLKPNVHNEGGTRLTVYQCRWCEWYHVGHETKKRSKISTVYVDL